MPSRVLMHRYRLVEEIGRGGMGTVWLGNDELLDREVAVKEVRIPDGLEDEERETLLERTMREARICARLNHPSIITVHDVVREDERPWIVMELLKGRGLEKIVAQDGPMPLAKVADIGRQTLSALRRAHESNVLHRDIKPSNVLVTNDGRAVVTDFGIAATEGETRLTVSGGMIGSPGYVAPERVDPGVTRAESDLWALGATLYFMAEGRPAYGREGTTAKVLAPLTHAPDAPRLSGPLWPVIQGLLIRDPDQRIGAEAAEYQLTELAANGGEAAGTGPQRTPSGPQQPSGPQRTPSGPYSVPPAGGSAPSGPYPVPGPGPQAWSQQPGPQTPHSAPLPPPPPTGPRPAPSSGQWSPPPGPPPQPSTGGYGNGPTGGHSAWQPSPAPPPRRGSGGPSGRMYALIAVAVAGVLVLAAGGVGAAVWFSSDSGTPSAGTTYAPETGSEPSESLPDGPDPTESTTNPSAQPSAQESPGEPAPEGTAWHMDDLGFRFAAPQGWAQSQDQGSTLFTSPDTFHLVNYSPGYLDTEDPKAFAEQMESNWKPDYTSYERISMEPVDHPDGDALQWDFRFKEEGKDMVRARAIVLITESGAQRLLMYYTYETLWDRKADLRETVLDSLEYTE